MQRPRIPSPRPAPQNPARIPPGTARAAPGVPLPRRTCGQFPDGRAWEVSADGDGASVRMAGRTVAEAHLWSRDEQLTMEFWVDGQDLPGQVGAQLVAAAFAEPAVRDHQPVLICLPRRDGGLLEHVRRHVEGARTRAAGMSCLVEGTVCKTAPGSRVPPAS